MAKTGRKPLRREKIAMSNANLNCNDWEVLFYDSDVYLKIRNKKTGKIKLIDKYVKSVV